MSLVELLVSLSIIVIIVLVVVNIFVSSARFSKTEQSRIEVGTAASRIFSNLDDYLHEGRQVLASATINSTTYTTSDSTLVLALPSLVNGAPTSTSDTIVIQRLADGQLVAIISPYVDQSNSANNSTRVAETLTLSTNVNSAYFRYTTSDPTQSNSVTVTMIVQKISSSQAYSQKAILNATLRNHL